LESVEEDDGDQMARKQQRDGEKDEKRRGQRSKLARPRTPESNRVDNHSVINQLFECLNTITNQLQLSVAAATAIWHIKLE
jgi:hypothetical protein